MEHIPSHSSDSTDEQESFSDKDIFIKIWLSPRKVFKYILENHYEKYTVLLLILAGISSAFFNAIEKDIGFQFSFPTIILICVIGGGLLGWLYLYIFAFMLSWTGEMAQR